MDHDTGGHEPFGRIALRSDLITQGHLKRALDIQESEEEAKRRKLGAILVAMGVIRQTDVRQILDVQQLMRVPSGKVRFGVAAIQNTYATKEQVDRCLRLQRNADGTPEKLGEIMVKEGVITEEQKELLLKGVHRLEGDESGPQSRLVQALRRIDEGGAPTRIHHSVQGVRMADVERLIQEGVRSFTHVGILAHIAVNPKKSYTFREFAEALDDEEEAVRRALRDLEVLGLVTPKKGWFVTRLYYAGEPHLQRRADLLLASLRDPLCQADILDLLLKRA